MTNWLSANPFKVNPMSTKLTPGDRLVLERIRDQRGAWVVPMADSVYETTRRLARKGLVAFRSRGPTLGMEAYVTDEGLRALEKVAG